MRRLALALALTAGLAGPAAAEPKSEEAAIEALARVIIFADKCPRARLNYLTLGIVLERHRVSKETLEAGGRHNAIFVAAIGKLQAAFDAATAEEACTLLFDLYGGKGSDVRGLVFEADPNDIFAFFDAIGRGFGNLRKIIGEKPKGAPQ